MKNQVSTRATPRALKKFIRPTKPLAVALLEALQDELGNAIELGDFDSGLATALPGADMDYADWLRVYAPHSASSKLGEHHHRAWKWAEDITPGKFVPALIECWFRGGGKSTTMELIVSRLAVKATRRFAVYVCATQDMADRHVQDIATAMERCGIERAVNKYGFSKGWSASKLRTANGFNVLAFGLDTGARGVKLDHLRPDMIILDDIDELDDSVNAVDKKIRTITQTILPAKSTDCAVVFVQNRIHANSVMSQVLSGDLDMLQDRIQSPIIPAVQDLEYTTYERNDGRMGYRITAGTPTWQHKTLEVCQHEIDTYGLLSFLRECQHEVGVGGLFFPDFREYNTDGKPWHVVDHVEIQPWWRMWASHDFGTGAPACFLLYASDDRENIYVIGEMYEAGLVSSKQAEKCLELLESKQLGSPANIKVRDGIWNTKLEAIAFDWANTFPPMKAEERIGEYPVEIWWERGLPAVRAVKDRKAGWRRVKEWLSATDIVEGQPKPKLQIVRGACPNLIKQISATMAHPRDPEDIDSGTKNDHAIDSFRYGVMWREYPVKCPEIDDKMPSNEKHIPSWLKKKDNSRWL
jgi:hypothetical protein